MCRDAISDSTRTHARAGRPAGRVITYRTVIIITIVIRWASIRLSCGGVRWGVRRTYVISTRSVGVMSRSGAERAWGGNRRRRWRRRSVFSNNRLLSSHCSILPHTRVSSSPVEFVVRVFASRDGRRRRRRPGERTDRSGNGPVRMMSEGPESKPSHRHSRILFVWLTLECVFEPG